MSLQPNLQNDCAKKLNPPLLYPTPGQRRRGDFGSTP
jgi:hypothetical protein